MIETCFFYYGIVRPFIDFGNHMHMFKNLRKDIYCYMLDHNLHYRRVGDVHHVSRIVAGKELAISPDNPYLLNASYPYEIMDDTDIDKYRLSEKEERQIRDNLYSAGCYAVPRYYVTYNYIADPPAD